MRLRFLVCFLVLVACGSEPSATTTSTTAAAVPTATEVTEELYAALRSEDFGATRALVDDEGLVLLTAIESNSAGALLVSEERRIQVRENFWGAFVETATEFQSDDAVLVITEGDRVGVDDHLFQVVSVRDELGGSEATWVLRQTDSGWLIDPIATFGASFAGPIEIWLSSLAEPDRQEALPIVADQLASWNALQALLDDSESGVAVASVLDRLIPQLQSVADTP